MCKVLDSISIATKIKVNILMELAASIITCIELQE